MYKKIIHKIMLPVQLVLVLLFILFEETIWDGIAKPIYSYVRSLRLLKTLEHKLGLLDRRIVLVLFLLLFVAVEGAGLLAGVMMVQGLVVSATLLYLSKIPIAAFTFWMFRVCEEKLLSFGWFSWSYEKIILFVDWIKSIPIYKNTTQYAKQTKAWLKERYHGFKSDYLTGDGVISKRFRRLYRWMKGKLGKATQ